MADVRIERLEQILAARPPVELPRHDGAKTAAVAAILRPSEEGSDVLLIRRAENPRDPWSGHMAFPGGRREPHDEDLLATAVRETQEEIGLDLRRSARLLGPLDELEAVARGVRTGLVIRPYVFVLGADEQPAPRSAAEVAEVLWSPLGPLARGEADRTYPYRQHGFSLDLPAFDVSGRIVWGLTHQMLTSLFARLREGL